MASRVAYAFSGIRPISIANNVDISTIKLYLDSVFEATKITVITDDNMGSVIYHLGRAYNELEYYQEAEEFSRIATEINHPQSILAWIQLQKALSLQCKNEEA